MPNGGVRDWTTAGLGGPEDDAEPMPKAIESEGNGEDLPAELVLRRRNESLWCLLFSLSRSFLASPLLAALRSVRNLPAASILTGDMEDASDEPQEADGADGDVGSEKLSDDSAAWVEEREKRLDADDWRPV